MSWRSGVFLMELVPRPAPSSAHAFGTGAPPDGGGSELRSAPQDPPRPRAESRRVMTPMPRTKIVCSIGPASRSPETVEQLIRAGMDVAQRLWRSLAATTTIGFVDGRRQVIAGHTLATHLVGKIARPVGRPRVPVWGPVPTGRVLPAIAVATWPASGQAPRRTIRRSNGTRSERDGHRRVPRPLPRCRPARLERQGVHERHGRLGALARVRSPGRPAQQRPPPRVRAARCHGSEDRGFAEASHATIRGARTIQRSAGSRIPGSLPVRTGRDRGTSSRKRS
jgi:Pyruvate kinase, barrel domain